MMNIYFFYRLAFLTVFMILLTDWKYNLKKSYMIISSFMLIIWFINTVILVATNTDFSNILYPLTVSVPTLICFWLVSKSDFTKVLFSFITVCNFGMLTSFFGLLAYFYSGRFLFRVLAEFICFCVIAFLIFRFFRKPYFKILHTITNGWGYLCSAPCLLAVAIYLSLYYPSEIKHWPENIITTAIIFILMFTFYFIIYMSFENIAQYYKLKHDKEFMLMQGSLQEKEYAAILENMNTINIFRHDIRHHLNFLNTLLDNDNISEAKNYIGNLNNNLSATTITQYCENYMVNVILSSYISKANAHDIEVTCHANISEGIRIENIDHIELGSVFANSIENSINACMLNTTPSKKTISILCKEHFSQLYIQVTNPLSAEITFNGEFPISPNKEHGFGTQSIAAVAEKNGGIFSFTAEDGIFKATVILNLS